jgi:hypothetical protein
MLIRIVLALPIQIVAAAVFLTPLFAADDHEVVVRPVSGKIQIDGILNDSMWQEAPSSIVLTQVDPHPGEAPTEATEMRRDAFLSSNDNLEIVLDTFHDHRNAYFFATNASGAMVDGRVTENQFASMEWDGIWNVRTHIDEAE